MEKMAVVEILPHLSLSPNAALSYYGLFGSLVHFLCDQRFNTLDEVKEASVLIKSQRTRTDSDAG